MEQKQKKILQHKYTANDTELNARLSWLSELLKVEI